MRESDEEVGQVLCPVSEEVIFELTFEAEMLRVTCHMMSLENQVFC